MNVQTILEAVGTFHSWGLNHFFFFLQPLGSCFACYWGESWKKKCYINNELYIILCFEKTSDFAFYLSLEHVSSIQVKIWMTWKLLVFAQYDRSDG